MYEGIKSNGSPSPRTAKNEVGEAANDISTMIAQKGNCASGDLLARTIACRPPNEDRIRGIAA